MQNRKNNRGFITNSSANKPEIGRGTQRLAIRRNGVDIARLMPGALDGNRLDIKLSLLGHEFEVYTYPLLAINPNVLVPDATQGKDITYHHGSEGKDIVIHIKNEEADAGDLKYVNLPISKIVPPNTDTLVPLPLLKLEVPRDIGAARKKKRSRKRPGKQVFEMDADCDVVEVFMTAREWSFKDMVAMFPALPDLMLCMPFESWSSNSGTVNQSKRAVVPHGEPKSRISSHAFGDICLLVVQYPQPFMPSPRNIRVTFIENAFAEAIMLHAQVRRTQDGGHLLLATPIVANISIPDFMRVRNNAYGDLWAWSMRMGNVNRAQYEALTHRVDRGRLDLLHGIKEHDDELSASMGKVSSAFCLIEAEFSSFPGNSFDKGVAIAAALGVLPAVIHSTRIASSTAGIDEEYCFLTLGHDVDLHYDIARICKLADAPLKGTTCRTEGRPFEEGLAGMRTRLELAGYTCMQTDTSILLPPLSEEDGLARLVPLYSKEGLVSSYKNMSAVEKEKLKSQVDEDFFQFLRTLDGELTMEPGLFAYDVMRIEREVDGNKLDSAMRGKMDEAEWRHLVRTLNLLADSFKGLQRAYRSVKLAEEEFLAKCSPESVRSRIAQYATEEDLLIEANLATERLSFSLSSFAKAAASFSDTTIDASNLSGIESMASEDTRAFQFMTNLLLFLLNSPKLFQGVSGSAGAGEWMCCRKSNLLAWDGWTDDMREFIEQAGTEQVDIPSIAREALSFAESVRRGAIRLKAEDIMKAAREYVSVKEKYGVEGTLYAMHVPENMTGDQSLLLESLELPCLIQALDDVGEVVVNAPQERATIEELIKEIEPLKFDLQSSNSDYTHNPNG